MPSPAAVEIDAQYRQLREECGLVDRSERGKLMVEGAEAAEYLQSQVTNDIEALAPGEGCYAALLDRKGHIQADMRALRLGDDRIWIDTEAAAADQLRRHLEMYKIGRQVEIADVGAERAILALVGPATSTVTAAAVLGEHESEVTSVAGVECLLVGTDGGADLICNHDEAGRLHDALLAAGAADVDEAAAEILRIERGRPRYGLEIGASTMPAEVGIVADAV